MLPSMSTVVHLSTMSSRQRISGQRIRVTYHELRRDVASVLAEPYQRHRRQVVVYSKVCRWFTISHSLCCNAKDCNRRHEKDQVVELSGGWVRWAAEDDEEARVECLLRSASRRFLRRRFLLRRKVAADSEGLPVA